MNLYNRWCWLLWWC